MTLLNNNKKHRPDPGLYIVSKLTSRLSYILTKKKCDYEIGILKALKRS